MLQHFSRLFFLLTLITLIYSCANRVTPTGGDKDMKPPVIKEFSPPNYSTRFTTKKITVSFNEFIQLKDIQKQLIISPPMEPEPKISTHKKNLIILLPDSLKPNTTYTLNFGEAVADLNEGNPVTDFQYIFSTGDVLDSLFCSGKVMDAYSHKTEKGIIVMLYHDKDDSLPFKKLPDYFARTDEQGNYTIKNISPGTYKLFALNDKNNNYKCDNPQEEAIAFADAFIQVPDSQQQLLVLFTQMPAKLFVKRAIKESNGPVIISFNKPIESLSWRTLNTTIASATLLTNVSPAQDSLFIWVKDSTLDTLKLELLNNEIPFDTIEVKLKRSTGREKIKTAAFAFISNVAAGEIKPDDTLTLSFRNPVMSASLNEVKIFQDTVPLSDYKISFKDSLHRFVVIQSKWTENTQYKLVALHGTFKDVYNNNSDSILINFRLTPVTELGTLKTTVTGIIKNQTYILQLVNESLQIIQQKSIDSSTNYIFENISPGSYKIRLLNDNNKNNKWDSGDYWKKIQPEQFYYYPDAIQIRANWELEINLNAK